ncbi:hypothetical protein G3I78_48585, partial [Streptomyces sp. SID13726]|nr:hypothetical protein [Streptomyces sp. SID13726]
VHVTPYSADKAICEANFAATRVQRKGPFFILGGDINYPPQAGPDPEFDRMKPYNRGARLILGDPENPGLPVADRRVSWTLAANGLVDAAWHLYGKTADQDLLQRTGSDDRIDQIWVSPALAPAITDYGVVSGGSDHKGVWIRLDLT